MCLLQLRIELDLKALIIFRQNRNNTICVVNLRNEVQNNNSDLTNGNREIVDEMVSRTVALTLPFGGASRLVVVRHCQGLAAKGREALDEYVRRPNPTTVLLLLADGEPVEAAARHLGLCVSTVRRHVRSLLGKTQAPSLMQLLRWTGSARPWTDGTRFAITLGHPRQHGAARPHGRHRWCSE